MIRSSLFWKIQFTRSANYLTICREMSKEKFYREFFINVISRPTFERVVSAKIDLFWFFVYIYGYMWKKTQKEQILAVTPFSKVGLDIWAYDRESGKIYVCTGLKHSPDFTILHSPCVLLQRSDPYERSRSLEWSTQIWSVQRSEPFCPSLV